MKSLVPRLPSSGLAAGDAPNDQASAAFFTTLPLLIVDRANLPTTAAQLADLLSAGGAVFERGGQIVRISQAADGPQVERLNAHGVVLEAHKVCRPVLDKFSQGIIIRESVTLPSSVAKLFLNMGGDSNLPVLKGICHAPLLSNDGSISCSTGYHRPQGVWCVGAPTPTVAAQPTLEDAKASLQIIRETFASFPFADSVRAGAGSDASIDLAQDPGADESAFLVALLTASCRPSLPHAPGLVVRAPPLSGAGTGKGLLIHALAEIAFAQQPNAFTRGGDGQELAKRIESALFKSGPMVFIDNCNSALLRSNALAQVITESSVDCRPLGQSKMVPLNTNAFIAVTGNDLQISEDLARRFIVSNLDAKCENPEQRRFDGDFKAVLTANRQKLQASLLTIWRWGRQNRLQPGIPLGTFEIWASWCRDPLMALGCLDPVQRIADLKADDPMRQGIAEIFQTWFDIHGSTLIKFRDLDPRVRCLLGKNRQSQVTALQRLENARTGGFLLKAVNAQGYWGKKKYSISQTPDAL